MPEQPTREEIIAALREYRDATRVYRALPLFQVDAAIAQIEADGKRIAELENKITQMQTVRCPVCGCRQ